MNPQLSIKEKLAAASAPAHKDAPKPEEAKQEDHKGKNPKGYQSMRLRQLIKAEGAIVKPDADGIFVPKDQEEYDMLEHLADSKMNMVERVY